MAEFEASDQERKYFYVFIDDSNLWIEGQKYKGQKLKDSGMDPRFRVDLGRLLSLLIKKDDQLVKAFLYGSRPPPNDTVWRVARQKNFVVDVFDRAGGVESGREKEVDIAMASCMTWEASELKSAYKYGADLPYDISDVMFVIVTGDRDMKPAVTKVLDAGIHVELWAWKKAISVVYKQIANLRPEIMKVFDLDSVESKFGYTHMQSTRKPGDINPAHSIVFQDLGGSRRVVEDLSNNLLRLYRLFFTTSIGNHDVIVEFPKSPVEVVLQQLKKYHNFGYKVCSYPEYATQKKYATHKDGHPPLSLSNRYSVLQDHDVDTSDTEATEDALDSLLSPTPVLAIAIASFEMDSDPPDTKGLTDDNWEMVLRTNPGAYTRRQRKHEIPCNFGIHCAKASSCPYYHTPEERQVFQKYQHRFQPFKFWKIKQCEKSTPHNPKECTYAHGSEDAWCLYCKLWGHFTDTCKAKL